MRYRFASRSFFSLPTYLPTYLPGTPPRTVLPPLSPSFWGRGVGGEGPIRVAVAIRFEAERVAPRTGAGTAWARPGLRRGGPLIPSPSPPGSPGEKGGRRIQQRGRALLPARHSAGPAWARPGLRRDSPLNPDPSPPGSPGEKGGRRTQKLGWASCGQCLYPASNCRPLGSDSPNTWRCSSKSNWPPSRTSCSR